MNEENEELTEEKMNKLLARLVDTEYWEAILKFNRIKDVEAMTVLATNDPFVNPTKTAKSQGIRDGIYYLESFAMSENERTKRENMEKEEKK